MSEGQEPLSSNGHLIIYLLTSFDGGYIHQESWSWVGYVDGTAEGRQSREPRKTHRDVYLPQLGNPAICVHVCAAVCANAD